MRKKKRNPEEKDADKKARAENILDELDQQMRVRRMAAGDSGSRPPVIDVKGDNVVPLTIVIELVPIADGTIVDDSGT